MSQEFSPPVPPTDVAVTSSKKTASKEMLLKGKQRNQVYRGKSTSPYNEILFRKEHCPPPSRIKAALGGGHTSLLPPIGPLNTMQRFYNVATDDTQR